MDHAAATELALFIENDGDLYRQQTQPIFKNLITKMARGIYDRDKAVKLMGYLMESGAKKYAKEYGGTWHQMFSVATRKHVAAQFVAAFEAEAKLGNYDNFLPKKYQKTKINPSRARRARAAIRGMGRVRRKRMIHSVLGTMTNPQFYTTFKRSATSWDSFARARKITYDTGLTYEQAQAQCREFNENRTAAQIRKGTKLEFRQQ